MFEPTTVCIDLEALSNNLRRVKSAAPKSKVLAMIKCNAYGHGAIEVAKKIEPEVGMFGVMFLKEALELHHAGIKKPLVILTGFFDGEELKTINRYGFNVTIHNFEQIKILEKTKLIHPLHVWFKIDTGMHRLGFQPHKVKDAYQKLMSHQMVVKPFCFMTHFSDADDMASSKTPSQIVRFKDAVAGLKGEWCMANSAAVLNWPETHASWIRPGILLYGASPFDDRTGLDLCLEPVMTLTSNIITTHELDKGETIGYGSTFKCPTKMRIGTVSTGYGDGYPRNAKDAPVLVTGARTKLLGRVAMDMMAVDLTHLPDAHIGSKVTLWGKGLPVEEISKCSGEIPYELFCRLTSRVHYTLAI
jgi:alanine racemase